MAAKSPSKMTERSEELERVLAVLSDPASSSMHREWAYMIPAFQLRELVSRADIPTARNWLTRGQLGIEAQEGREKGKWRLFSTKDAMKMATALHLSRLGVPIAQQEAAAEYVSLAAQGYFASSKMAGGRPFIVIWNDGDWHLTQMDLVGKDLSITDFSKAPVVVSIDVARIITETVSALGLPSLDLVDPYAAPETSADV